MPDQTKIDELKANLRGNVPCLFLLELFILFFF
jgi:hypothetical protein